MPLTAASTLATKKHSRMPMPKLTQPPVERRPISSAIKDKSTPTGNQSIKRSIFLNRRVDKIKITLLK